MEVGTETGTNEGRRLAEGGGAPRVEDRINRFGSTRTTLVVAVVVGCELNLVELFVGAAGVVASSESTSSSEAEESSMPRLGVGGKTQISGM